MRDKILTGLVAGLLIFMPIMACKSLSLDGTPPPPGYELVLTTQSELLPLVSPDEVVILDEPLVPDKVEEALGATATNLVVITPSKNVQPESTTAIPIEGVDLGSEDGWLDFLTNPGVHSILTGLLTGVEGAAPFLLGIEGLLAIFSSRKRQHYASAAKNLATFKPGEAVKSAVKALGAMHTEA